MDEVKAKKVIRRANITAVTRLPLLAQSLPVRLCPLQYPNRANQLAIELMPLLSFTAAPRTGLSEMTKGPSNRFLALKSIGLTDELSGTEKRVAAAILDHFNHKTGQCDPAFGSIATLLCLHRRTVIRAVNGIVKKGFFVKRVNGGHYHRNQYEPVWSRFRVSEDGWKVRRKQMKENRLAASMSLSQGQTCHLADDKAVTQTPTTNSSKKTCVGQEPCERSFSEATAITAKGLSREGQQAGPFPKVHQHFHVKQRHGEIARDAAERRWNDALTKQMVHAPDVFADVIEAIDGPLREATTDAEFERRGRGIVFLLSEIDRRRALVLTRSHRPNDAAVPSRNSSASDVSDSDLSTAGADCESMKSLHSSSNMTPEVEPRGG